MKFNYTQSYKLKLSNIKDKNSYKIKDFEFEITDIFYDVILTEIEHQCGVGRGVGELKSFNFSIKPVQEKDKLKLSQRETEICKRDLLGEKTTN
tara:strand:- start:1215 stop:1496 length:282 start_codon:yes stop_codon:yes gene_type:complete